MRHADLPRVLRRAVGLMRFAREAVGASAASLFLVDTPAKSLNGIVSEWDWTRTSFGTEVSEWPTVAKSITDGEVRVISKAEATGAERGWFEPRGISSSVCVPLWHRDRAYGIIFIDFDDASTFDKDDTSLLADVGFRCGRALARDEKSIANLGVEKIVVGTEPLLPAESQRTVHALVDGAMNDVITAEKLLEEAIHALRDEKKQEKVFIGGTLEAAFVRLREAREELTRLQTLVGGS